MPPDSACFLAGILLPSSPRRSLTWRCGRRSVDLAAQLFRSELFAAHGFLAWNNYWYGGHYLLGYSLLFPPLGAAVGATVAGGLAAVAATALLLPARPCAATAPRAQLGDALVRRRG